MPSISFRRWPFRTRSGGPESEPERTRDRRPYLEIQIHPQGMRRRVRYLFLDRRQVRIGLAVGAGLALFLLFNLLITPAVILQLRARDAYAELVEERRRLGEILQQRNERLAELDTRSDDLYLRMSRIYLAYGLQTDRSEGQGGFPFEPQEVPESIYSRAIRQGSRLEARIAEQLEVLDTFVDEIESFEGAHGDQVRTTPSISPIRGASSFVLTSPFGNRRSPFTKKVDFHPGVDLAAPIGTPIRAAADGQVVYAGRYPLKQSVRWWRYGNLVALRNGDRFITLYGHCDEIQVRSGQSVAQGEVIATVGNSGWSTSPHLHYEVRRREEGGDFRPVDPRIYILDHRWRDEERLLVRARQAPGFGEFEPLPRIIGR